jgi:hypothetical protein
LTSTLVGAEWSASQPGQDPEWKFNLLSLLDVEMPSYTECGKLTSFFEYEMPYEKGS